MKGPKTLGILKDTVFRQGISQAEVPWLIPKNKQTKKITATKTIETLIFWRPYDWLIPFLGLHCPLHTIPLSLCYVHTCENVLCVGIGSTLGRSHATQDTLPSQCPHYQDFFYPK